MTPVELSSLQLAELRARLVRFARLQLRDDAAAGDVVQDALPSVDAIIRRRVLR